MHVRSVFEAVNMLDHAMKLRQVGSHEMNSRSNRSHFMTELFIELSGEFAVIVGTIKRLS